VEPLTAALQDARLSPSERASIARLFGRTGAARATPVLAALAREKGAVVRLAAIDAIGTLGPAAATRPEDLDPIIDALGDPDPSVRLHAAVALADVGDARARDVILAKLDAAEVDRRAILAALGGILARVPSDAAVARLGRELELAAGPERDAVAGALGLSHSAAAIKALTSLAAGPDVDDARTAATLLSAHGDEPRALAAARALLSHRDASVRAQAAWTLGTLGELGDVKTLTPLLHAGMDEAIDAASAIGKIAARSRDPAAAAAVLCVLPETRPLVRAAALAGLSLARARCGDGAMERRLLADDPSDAVRASAALVVERAPAGDPDARALARCASEDRSGSVAARCRSPVLPPARSRAALVYVLPDLATTPEPGAAYLLLLADGTLHAGTADRRGAVFDPVTPDGDLSLLRPGER
jgi:HEAT repeat protein